ncbi:MAG: hypothetical protein R3F50_06935 [Gammaproteobacteria bacterium]|jgi:tetratricopeptide (TPR) repeat protein
MPDNDIEKIQPVEFDAANSPALTPASAAKKSDRPSPWVWFGLGMLALLALVVIFVLPTLVTEYELPLERRAVDVASVAPEPGQAPARASSNAVSPFTEAQRAIQRKEAQDVLAELLAVQAELDAIEVEAWAEVDYQSALAEAQAGDDAYLAQDFIGAQSSYQAGLSGLQGLLQRVPTVLEQTLVDGEAALGTGDSARALEKFSIAVKLDPENERAAIGLERAGNLDEVNAIIAEAESLLQAGQLETARDRFREAMDLDPQNSMARDAYGAINRQILENRFARVMSEGFSLLQNQQPERAIEAFEKAAALGINQDQAAAAIQQTRDAVALVEIDRLRSQAEEAQNAEQWQQVVARYEEVLEIDPNLVFAQQGLDYAGKRLRLDQLLEAAIASPERFADDQVYQQTVDVYYTGRNLESPGPRLRSQLDRLEALLESSQIPVTVNFVSDNATRVTLLRHEELGSFDARSLSLKPGRYVAMGIREGYRDVRTEFVVGFGQTPEAVVVVCEEEVVATRGR